VFVHFLDLNKQQIMRYKIAIILGSTRPNNICTHVAEWVKKTIESFNKIELSIINLADWNLPFLDEPGIPAAGSYQHEHTKAWSQRVLLEDGFIFVTPQYNWGYPAPLKNAIDYLYKEWNDKNGLIIPYGGHGGNKAATQLKEVLEEGCKMKIVDKMPGIILSREIIKDQIRTDLDKHFQPHAQDVRQAVEQLIAALDAK
jgi:NAD(P)H-dependent FMN reductase